MRSPTLLVIAGMVACSHDRRPASEDKALAFGSVADVRAVLESGGAPSLRLDCENVAHAGGEVIRTIACTTTLAPAPLAQLEATLGLRPGPAFHAEMRNACESLPGFRTSDPSVEILVGENARVPNGIERVQIHVVRSTGAACVEVTYPWSS